MESSQPWGRALLAPRNPSALRPGLAGAYALALTLTGGGCDGDPDPGGRRFVPEATLPPPARWTPPPDEVLPEAKQLAADVAAARTTDRLGSPPSVGRVIYPQLVGFAEGRAAVTVLVEQTFLDPERGNEVVRRVLDLRLGHAPDGWSLDASASGGGIPEGPPASTGAITPGASDAPGPADPPSASARQVLQHPGIHLPHTARADILEGAVTDGLLELLAAIGDRHEIQVMTLVSERPTRVFGTDRLSHHAVGRAADLYAVDGVPVVSQRFEGSPAHELVLWLFEQEGVHVGSPWTLDGFGGRSFTDLVHQDHLHVAVPP